MSLICLCVVLLGGCAVTGVMTQGNLPPRATTRTCFNLVAAKQHERVLRAFKRAGVCVSDKWRDNRLTLKTFIGINKGSRRCGSKNTVKLQVTSAYGDTFVMKAQGWTGKCRPNTITEVAQTFRSMLEQQTRKKKP